MTNRPEQNMSAAQLQVMLENQVKEQARDTSMGLAAQFVNSMVQAGADVNVKAKFFSLVDEIQPELTDRFLRDKKEAIDRASVISKLTGPLQ